tara:strand:+ start:202 stop:1650 length:1449 start_codon:yes stop_codon:yes gene_type:complete
VQIKTKSLALLSLASLLLVSACTIQLRVKLDLAEDGSGQITAGIGLDEQARNQPAFQNIEEALRISDLIEAGWEFESAGLGSDGREWFESTKSFADPDDLQKVLNELTNSPEAFKDWEFSSEITSKTRDFVISGVVDLTDGLNLFTDESLNKLLDEPPLGIAIETIEESLGTSINETISLQVIVNLPDQSNEEIIDIPLGEERVVEVTGNSEHRVAQILDWVVLAVLALLALSIILAILNWYLDKRYEQRQLQRRPSPIAQQIPGNEIAFLQQPSTQTERLQLLVIDPYGTIFKEENTPLEHLRAFINKKEGNSNPDELLDLHHSVTMGKLTSSEFWNQVGLTESPDSLNHEYVKSLQFRSGGKEFLKNLHKRGIAVSVVTNDLIEWSTQIREIYGLQGIHPWIISSEYGVRKPDPAILEILNRSSGIAYQSCLVLDTATNFLDTAQTLGMKTVHLNPEANKSDANQKHPSVRRLNEFFKGQ